jgi:hypothetical protein
MKTTKRTALIVKSTIKAGCLAFNHNRSLLKKALVVKSTIKAGCLAFNHNRPLLA